MDNSSESKRSNTEALLRMQRIQIILTACILIVVLAAGIFLALQFNSINRVVDLIDQRVQSFDMEALNDAVDSFSEASDKITSIDIDELNRTVTSLKEAADNIGSMDIKKLNDAVTALKDAAKNLSGIDVESLNSLVQALQSVAERLERAVSTISGIFGR